MMRPSRWIIRNVIARKSKLYYSSSTIKCLEHGQADLKSVSLKKEDPPRKLINQDDSISPWQEIVDPKGSGKIYYWNKVTDETTELGSPRPLHWVEIADPTGKTNLTYWWNPETNTTTPLGAEKPHYLLTPVNQSIFNDVQPPRASLGKAMTMYVALGAGVALGSILIRSLF